MKVYGLTGGIASGKSTVANYLVEHGYVVIDSDKIAREAFKDLDCLNKVQELFGCVKNNQVDRKALGKIVFNNENKRKQLEGITHPYIVDKLKEGILNNRDKKFIFLDIPLLFEANLEYLVDEIIVVYLNQENQLRRLMIRDNVDENYARIVMNNQMSNDIKKSKANIVLDNNGTLDDLIKQTETMLKGF